MTVDQSVLVPLGSTETFALITEPDRLRRWQAVTARIDPKVGGEYRFTITPGHSAAGVVKEVVPGQRLVMTWGWEGDDQLPPGASTVTITLEPATEGTTVRLVHEGLDDEQSAGHIQGWTHYLFRLSEAGTKGDAGADPWAGPTENLDNLTAAEAALASCQVVLRGLDSSHAAMPTPCAKFTVQDLLEHLLNSLRLLGGAAGAQVPNVSGTAEHRVAVSAQSGLEAWRRRGNDGTVNMGGNDMAASMVTAILAIELLVHGWDLAKASSQTLPVNDEVAAYVLEQAHGIIGDALRDGDRFGQKVTPAPDADGITRLVAFTGRSA